LSYFFSLLLLADTCLSSMIFYIAAVYAAPIRRHATLPLIIANA